MKKDLQNISIHHLLYLFSNLLFVWLKPTFVPSPGINIKHIINQGHSYEIFIKQMRNIIWIKMYWLGENISPWNVILTLICHHMVGFRFGQQEFSVYSGCKNHTGGIWELFVWTIQNFSLNLKLCSFHKKMVKLWSKFNCTGEKKHICIQSKLLKIIIKKEIWFLCFKLFLGFINKPNKCHKKT